MATPMTSAAAVARDAERATPTPQEVGAHMFAADRASQGLGMRIVALGAGSARLEMAIRDDMLNGHEICHGGFVFTLADSAFAYACNSYNLNTVASGCAIEFTAPAQRGETLTARARERQLAGRTGVYDVEVANERGETVALFRGKSYRIKGHLIDETPG